LKISAISRRDAPLSTASTARSRKSVEYGLGIDLAPQANQFPQIRLGDSGWESLRFNADGKCSRIRLMIEGRSRDLAMFNLAIDSKLRGCDVVALKVEDVAPNGYAIDRATIRQRKTGRPVKFELTEQTREAVDGYLRALGKKPNEFLFTSRRDKGRCMTTRQYARLVSEWIAGIGLEPKLFGTHSLRRTKATLIYRRTGNLRAVQLLLGHTKIESTVRYLGVEVDDALAIAEQVEV
jgi:integrase